MGSGLVTGMGKRNIQSSPRHVAYAVDRGNGRGRLYKNITEVIGNTPCVEISGLMCPQGRTIYAKLEYFNPLSSVKDRLALAVIEDAEKQGLLRKGDTVIEATSGNMGVSLAMICAQRGYNCVIVMADSFSSERRKLMRFLGAKVILTPSSAKGTGMVAKAKELAEKNGWHLCRQFETQANSRIHEATTGPEILSDFHGERLDYFVLGCGTGGTYSGASKAIKASRPNVKACIAEPEEAALVSSGIPTERHPDGSAKYSHPAFRSHLIQGWTPDFIPEILEKALEEIPYDEIVHVPGQEARRVSYMLARTQGIFTGPSGGGAMYAAIELARKAPEGSVLVVILADTGERYLTASLFEGIAAEMDKEELQISRGSPSFQM